MAYRIEFTAAARRQLRRLAPEVRRRLAPAIDRLADDPRPSGVVKLGGADLGYRLRVGDYRIVYELYDDRLVVLVIRVGHRREVYRGLG